MIFNVYKQKGETPLECVQRFREVHKEFDTKKALEREKVKWTYMGRLDPLAEGVLLLANREDIKRKEEFLGLDKEYEFTLVFGFATDTYDIMGKVTTEEKVGELNEMDMIKLASIYKGKREQTYPPYSSRTVSVDGKPKKPLFELAREGTLNEEDIPKKEIEIYKIDFVRLDVLRAKEFFGRLLMDISRVKGDFRQNQILILWRKILEKDFDKKIYVAKFVAHVSSGTYIRSIVENMGKTMGVGATTLSIRRNKVGEYNIEDSIKF